MKCMIVLACAALASAQEVTLKRHPGGAVTPVETPEVQAATAAHLAAKTNQVYGAYPYNYALTGAYGLQNTGLYNHGLYNHGLYNHGLYNNGLYNNGLYNHGLYSHGIYNTGLNAAYNGYHGYGLPYHGVRPLVKHSNGAVVPHDDADVVIARQQHFAAKAAATAKVLKQVVPSVNYLSNAGYVAPASTYAPAYNHYATPINQINSYHPYVTPVHTHVTAEPIRLVQHSNGALVPVESDEVATARAEHLQAVADAAAGVHADH